MKTEMMGTLTKETHEQYEVFAKLMMDRFSAAVESGEPLFVINNERRTFTPTWQLAGKPTASIVSAEPGDAIKDYMDIPWNSLFDAYLNGIPVDVRQEYNCHTCKRFLDSYGGIVTIDENFEIKSALWDLEGVPDKFAGSVENILNIIKDKRTRIAATFITDEEMAGFEYLGGYDHLHLEIPKTIRRPRNCVDSVYQAKASVVQDRIVLINSIKRYKLEDVKKLLLIMKSDGMNDPQFVGQVEWIHNIMTLVNDKKGRSFENIIWHQVATAPAGFTHFKNNVVGKMLDKIADGDSIDYVISSFKDMTRGDTYKRQTSTSAGNIKRAEEIVEKKGLKPSFERRYARNDEVVKIWEPAVVAEPEPTTGGMFDHLKKDLQGSTGPVDVSDDVKTTITWVNFAKKVLPDVESMELYVPAQGSFTAFVTALNEDAPPIIAWDFEDSRNPVSSYVHYPIGHAGHWNLQSGRYVKVYGIAEQPYHWTNPEYQRARGLTFLLEGAHDKAAEGANLGNCLFPDILKGDLYEVRATIEQYSKSAVLYGAKEDYAAGICYVETQTWNAVVKVKTPLGVVKYRIDRFE